jgi:ParB-like chromosome segregation protein Spo0J
MSAPFQLYGALDVGTEAALRASIQKFGVLIPVVVDQRGRILDGHHRKRIAAELKHACPTKTIHVKDDGHAKEIATTLNKDRRQLPAEERIPVVAALREEGHSLRAIGAALGVSQTQVANDLKTSGVNHFTPEKNPKKVKGVDGKQYPEKQKKAAATKPAPSAPARKPAAPPKEEQLHIEIADLRAKLEEATDEVERLSALEQGEESALIKRLQAELKSTQAARDESMRQVVELKKQVRMLERKAA